MTRALDPTGHLTDEAIVLLADGALPASEVEAVGHLEACDACAARVADAALLSLATHAALAGQSAREEERAAVVAPSPVALAIARPAPSPRWPLVGGAALLLLVVVPTLAMDGPNLASTGRFLRTCAGVLARGVMQAAHRDERLSSSFGTWILAFAFALAGVVVARMASRSKNRSTNGALS